jgi:hypothetical protein
MMGSGMSGMMGGRPGGGMSMPPGAGMGNSGMMGGRPGGPGMAGGRPGGGMGGNAFGNAGAPAGPPPDETDVPKSEADTVMIRSIDFTVQPGETYRYRVRIVVVNPNRYHPNVNPGVDTDSDELVGPWSAEPTDAVTMPTDVAAYAINMVPKSSRRDDIVQFQLVRWIPEDGHTVVKTDDAGPGMLIGEPSNAMIPGVEGKKAELKPIDFNSRQFVLDSIGGQLSAPPAVKSTAPFDEPALALVLRPDGSVAIHTQASDVTDPMRIYVEKSYKQLVKDSTKRRRRAGGMSGMMGGGMMGSGGSGGPR